jgi:hypothetical protein
MALDLTTHKWVFLAMISWNRNEVAGSQSANRLDCLSDVIQTYFKNVSSSPNFYSYYTK